MATRSSHKRLAREYKTISANPPPGITAHPSESNILEWHYIVTGPQGTPYEGGQYWGTLIFPLDYPFAPPAIRMHTPSGRFLPSTRLCLSISDYHPKSFNPAWEVSTILLGLQSFMTGNELTTGSIDAPAQTRTDLAKKTRWWNSTGGGTSTRTIPSQAAGSSTPAVKAQAGNIKAGDGGQKFREQWPELDEENWKWMEDNKIDTLTGLPTARTVCAPEARALGKRTQGSGTGVGAVVQGGQAARAGAQGWVGRYKWHVALVSLFAYVLMARILGESSN